MFFGTLTNLWNNCEICSLFNSIFDHWTEKHYDETSAMIHRKYIELVLNEYSSIVIHVMAALHCDFIRKTSVTQHTLNGEFHVYICYFSYLLCDICTCALVYELRKSPLIGI